MSQSFEDKLREKLEAYPSTPPADAERAILNQVRSNPWPRRWSGALFVIAIGLLPVFFGNFHSGNVLSANQGPERPSPQKQPLVSTRTKEKEEDHPSEQQEVAILPPNNERISEVENSAPAERSNRGSAKKPPIVTSEPQSPITSDTSTTIIDRPFVINESRADEAPPQEEELRLRQGPASNWDKKASLVYVARMEPAYLSSADLARPDLSGLDLLERDSVEQVSKSPSHFKPYFDFGTFFLYQNMQPNTDDDVYITDFESAGRFSRKRLGLITEIGLRRQVNDKVIVRLGMSVSMLNQSYSFSIRNQQPDSVSFPGQDPQEAVSIFERSSIEVSHRLWAVGASFAGDFDILPDEGSTVFTAIGYHYLLNSNQSFVFNEEKHFITYPNQLLLTLGLRKLLWHRRYDQIYLSAQGRYAILGSGGQDAGTLSVKPFSIGLTLTWTRGKRK